MKIQSAGDKKDKCKNSEYPWIHSNLENFCIGGAYVAIALDFPISKATYHIHTYLNNRLIIMSM